MPSPVEYIGANLERFVSELQTVCRQPSISAQNKGMEEMARMLEARLRGVGLVTRVIEYEGAFPFVFGEWTGGKAKTLLFYNHYDVQPPEPYEAWRSDPFSAEIRDGRLYARGVADDKSMLMSRLHAIEAHLRTSGELPVNVKFLLEGEEEIGSPHLASFVADHKELLASDAAIWEFAEIDEAGRPHVTLGSKGMCSVELLVNAGDTDLHSMYAPVSENPAWRLAWALSTLKAPDGRIRIDGFYDGVRPFSPEELSVLEKTPFSLVPGAKQISSRWTDFEANRELYGSPTCNIATLLSGYTGPGIKTIVPSRAIARLDMRLVPDQSPDDIYAKLCWHLTKHGFDDIQVKRGASFIPFRTPATDPLVSAIARSANQAYGCEPVLELNTPASGSRANIGGPLRIPVAGIGMANEESNIHAPNENIKLADYAAGAKHVALLLQEYVSPDSVGRKEAAITRARTPRR